MMKYRAQVWNGSKWIDGILSGKERTANDDAVRLARRYSAPTRVIPVAELQHGAASDELVLVATDAGYEYATVVTRTKAAPATTLSHRGDPAVLVRFADRTEAWFAAARIRPLTTVAESTTVKS